jgi:glycosyltransferase involved in cell wall biosynthesis
VATVVISSKDRCGDLRGALASCRTQSVPLEVIVLDDGSKDGTAEMVRREFPEVRLVSEPVSRGYIVRRNQGAELATTPVIFSIDDDAAYVAPETIAQTLAEFSDPRIAAVAMPFCNVRQGPTILQQAPDAKRIYVCETFIGTAHALRREAFLAVGGYRPTLFHQGEEGDLAIRLLARGAVVRLGRAEPLHHFESPRRDYRRLDVQARRNDILFAMYNVPWPWLPVHLAGTTAKGLWFGLRSGRFRWSLEGCLAGWRDAWRLRHDRLPVPPAIYRLSRRLRKRGPVPLEEVVPHLPPLDGLTVATSPFRGTIKDCSSVLTRE